MTVSNESLECPENRSRCSHRSGCDPTHPDEEIPGFETQAERDAYLVVYADGHSAASRELLGPPPPPGDMQESLRATVRDAARLLFGVEALREIDQVSQHLAGVLTDVALERQAQDLKWGERYLQPGAWLAVLMEEVGEVATETLNPGRIVVPEGQPHRTALYLELVQVAAVAVVWAEQIRRDPPYYAWNMSGK